MQVIEVQPRSTRGKGPARKMRAEGKLPAKTEAFFKRGERWFASNKAMRQSDPAPPGTPSPRASGGSRLP